MPDIVNDQTSAHDPLHGYLPLGWNVAEWRAKQETHPKEVEIAARASIKHMWQRWLIFGMIITLDYGNNIRQVASRKGWRQHLAFRALCRHPVTFLQGIGPFRWCALSGDPEDIYKIAKVKELVDDAHLHKWLDMARDALPFKVCQRGFAGLTWSPPPFGACIQ